MFGLMVFSPVVGVVEFAGPPVNAELLLALSVSEPVELHVHRFCSFWLYFDIDDTIGH